MAKTPYHIPIGLPEFALWCLQHKKLEPTTGNLFYVMKEILNRCDTKNKNTKRKIISFRKGECVVRV